MKGVNPILIFIYRVLQGIAQLTLTIYYRKIVYINKKRLRAKSPVIVVANHPNTLIDPLLALMYTPEICFVLANYSMFKNPIAGWLLRKLFCIPVKRTQDVEEGAPRNNEDAFRQADLHLAAGFSLFVAPEGSSFTERHVRDCKTGTARILFGAMEKSNFNINICVLPIGITYMNALKFRTDVIVEVGELFSADKWQSLYKENPRQAIENFTQDIENQLITHSIHCKDVEEDRFLQKLEMIIQSEKPLDTEGAYFRSKKILNIIHHWQSTNALEFERFKHDVETFFARLSTLNVDKLPENTYNFLFSICKITLGFPFLVIGSIPNLLPATLSNSMVGWLKIDSAYDTTIKYCAGLIFFPLFWWIETEVFCSFFTPKDYDLPVFQTILLVLAFIASGLLAWTVFTEGVKFVEYRRFKNADKDNELSKTKQNILNKLNLYLNDA